MDETMCALRCADGPQQGGLASRGWLLGVCCSLSDDGEIWTALSCAAHSRPHRSGSPLAVAGSVLDPALPQPGPDSAAHAPAWPAPPASRGTAPPNVRPRRRRLRLGPRRSRPDGCNPGLPRPLPPSPSACNGPTSTHHHRYHPLHPYPPTSSPPTLRRPPNRPPAFPTAYRLPLPPV